MNADTSKMAKTYKVASGALGIAALLGWGLFAYSVSSSGTQEASLRQDVARLRNELGQLNAEHRRVAEEYGQLRQSAGELPGVQKQLASAREQVQSLEQARAQLTESVAQARAQLTSALEPTPDEGPSQTGAARPASTPGGQVRAAQEALTKLGFGDLKIDGQMGRNTRRAIEAFERAQGLSVTGELGATTVQALEAKSGIAIQ